MKEVIIILGPEVKRIMRKRVCLHNNFLIMGSLCVVYVCLGSRPLYLMLNGSGTVNSVLFLRCYSVIVLLEYSKVITCSCFVITQE